jgi:hypothetical protein
MGRRLVGFKHNLSALIRIANQWIRTMQHARNAPRIAFAFKVFDGRFQILFDCQIEKYLEHVPVMFFGYLIDDLAYKLGILGKYPSDQGSQTLVPGDLF